MNDFGLIADHFRKIFYYSEKLVIKKKKLLHDQSHIKYHPTENLKYLMDKTIRLG